MPWASTNRCAREAGATCFTSSGDTKSRPMTVACACAARNNPRLARGDECHGLLHNGRLVADGEPAEVIGSAVVQEAYLGVAAKPSPAGAAHA